MSQQPPVLIEFEIVVLVAGAQIDRFARQHLLQSIFFDLTTNRVDRKCSLAQNRILGRNLEVSGCVVGVEIVASG